MLTIPRMDEICVDTWCCMISRIKDILHTMVSTRAFVLKCGVSANTLNKQLNGVRVESVTVNSILMLI